MKTFLSFGLPTSSITIIIIIIDVWLIYIWINFLLKDTKSISIKAKIIINEHTSERKRFGFDELLTRITSFHVICILYLFDSIVSDIGDNIEEIRGNWKGINSKIDFCRHRHLYAVAVAVRFHSIFQWNTMYHGRYRYRFVHIDIIIIR